MQVDVIAVHNTIGDVKPLWIFLNGKKSKIDMINSTIKVKEITLFNCTVNGDIVVLSFNGVTWSLG
jgi:hypothetical protein